MTTGVVKRKESIDEYKELITKFEKRIRTLPKSVKTGFAEFRINGSYTNAVIYSNGKTKAVVGFGLSKRSSTDPRNEAIGKTVALWRALKSSVVVRR